MNLFGKNKAMTNDHIHPTCGRLANRWVVLLFIGLLVVNFGHQPVEAKLRQVKPEDIERIRLLGPNNEPVKIQVVLTRQAGTLKFVANLVKIVAQIHKIDKVPSEKKFTVQVFASDANILGDLKKLVGRKIMSEFVEVAPATLSGDIWMQDWGEISMVKVKGESKAQLLIIDSNRGQAGYQFMELAGLPPLLAKLWSAYYLKNPSPQPSGGDMGGNIEITPDDILVVGNTITPEFKEFFARNGYRDRMVVVEADWLTVGHCDEFLSVVPNDKIPVGYTIVKADPAYALKLILEADRTEIENIRNKEYKSSLSTLFDYLHGPADPKKDSLVTFLQKYQPYLGLSPQARVPRANLNSGKVTPREITLAEAEQFIRQNLVLSNMISANVAKMTQKVNEVNHLGNRQHSIVSFPMLYGKYHRGFLAYLPGVINQLILRKHLIVADPKIKVFRDAIRESARKAGLTTHFIDDTPYHERMGDVHCGTNVFRHPNRYIVKPKYLPEIWNPK